MRTKVYMVVCEGFYYGRLVTQDNKCCALYDAGRKGYIFLFRTDQLKFIGYL
jgi:hypothetical protein